MKRKLNSIKPKLPTVKKKARTRKNISELPEIYHPKSYPLTNRANDYLKSKLRVLEEKRL